MQLGLDKVVASTGLTAFVDGVEAGRKKKPRGGAKRNGGARKKKRRQNAIDLQNAAVSCTPCGQGRGGGELGLAMHLIECQLPGLPIHLTGKRGANDWLADVLGI